jgi:formate hydrogenlyase transcriptional activator
LEVNGDVKGGDDTFQFLSHFGWKLGSSSRWRLCGGLRPVLLPSEWCPLGGPGSFGIAGFGGTRAWANPELQLAYAYVPNLCSLGHFDGREAALSREAITSATCQMELSEPFCTFVTSEGKRPNVYLGTDRGVWMMSILSAARLETHSDRYDALLRMGKAVAVCGDCDTAKDVLAKELRELTGFDYLHLIAFEKATETASWQLLHAGGKKQDDPGPEAFLGDTPMAWVHERQQLLHTPDWQQERRFPKYGEFLRELQIASTCTLPLARGQRRLGVLTLGSSVPYAYPEDEVRFLAMVADQLALVLDAAVNLHSSELLQDRMQLILDLTNQVVSNLELGELLHAISASVRRVMGCDAAAVMLPAEEGKWLRVHALDYPDGKGIFTEGALVPIEGTLPGDSFKTGKPIVINRLDPATISSEMYHKAKAEGMNSFCDLPLISRKRLLGVLAVAHREENAFDDDQVNFLSQVANQVAIAIENATVYGEIARLKDKLAQEKLYLEDEIRGEMDFEGIVGQSSGLRHVLSLVETVAPSDSTVLLLGETGTGKELIARAIHDRSRRKDRTLVKLNCAAIPTGLLESELFGHERGAFTGAISQKVGRLELAHQGTLFLDEVGDIPFDIQPKLLRALQEREFERLGSTRTQRVDVRLVAATNRDLEKMIENREFRSDLYYRLNVFPIRIPPLRERPEDIPLLVRYFTQKYARRMEKQIESIPSAVMKKLSSWHWPGNIRELENFIERSVILTPGPALRVPVGEMANGGNGFVAPTAGDASEREKILRILKDTKGRVAGADGAAARMGIKRTTLISRMKKLGIQPRAVS